LHHPQQARREFDDHVGLLDLYLHKDPLLDLKQVEAFTARTVGD
jgi:hypothetical protein